MPKKKRQWYPYFPENGVPKIANVPTVKIFSARFAYAMCKKLDGIESQAGTTAWWVVRVDKGYGICEERLCPSNTSSNETDFVDIKITKEMLENAYKYRTPAYQRIRSLNDIKKVLVLNKQEATLSFDTFQGIYDAPKGYVRLPEANEKSVGVHCVRILGYDDVQQVLIFANSWGKKWGNKGIGYIPYSYLEKYIVECWATMLKRHWEELSQDLGTVYFTDKNGNAIKVQLHKVQPIVHGRSPLWVLDLYGRDGEISGWSHFSIVDYGNIIEVEDIFIFPECRNLGLGTKILEMIENVARGSFISEIRGWVSVQDIVEERESIVKRYFTKAGFDVIPDNTKFRGSYWRIQKSVSNSKHFNVNDKKVPPKIVDDMLNEIVARNPMRIP